MSPKKAVSISYPEFLKELTNELHYLEDGGTSYRKETAEFSLMIAKKVNNVAPFFNRDVAYETVSRFLPDMDVYRLQDVAKMLNVVLRDLHSKAIRSDELNAYLTERAKKRKPLKLVLSS